MDLVGGVEIYVKSSQRLCCEVTVVTTCFVSNGIFIGIGVCRVLHYVTHDYTFGAF